MSNIDTIATRAANNRQLIGKNTNKKDVYPIVEDLINSGVAPTEDQLATLYSFFMPALPAKPKTAQQWVQKAVAVKDVRYYLNNAHASSGFLRGTDGHRLHIAPIAGLFDGYYDKNGSKIDSDDKYPDVQRVIPANDRGRVKVDLSDLTKFDTRISGKIECIVLRADDPDNGQQKHYHVQSNYLRAALSNPSPLSCATIPAINDECGRMLLTFEDASIAVLMPIRV